MTEDNMFYIRDLSEPPKYQCPKCNDVGIAGIEVYHDEYLGKYCSKCFSKWLSENIPKMFCLDDHLAAKEE